MWEEFLGYSLLVAVFVCISSAIVAWAPTAATARKRFHWLFGISVTIAVLLFLFVTLRVYAELLQPVLYLLVFSFVLSDLLFIRPLLRRWVIPPCVGVRALAQEEGRRPVIIGSYVMVFVALMAPMEPWGWTSLRKVIPGTLVLVSIGGLFISTACQRAEICANGLWHDGALHEWSSFKCFAWREQGDKTVVELIHSKQLGTPFRGPVVPSRVIIVPPENLEAARKLLEANLANSVSEEARA